MDWEAYARVLEKTIVTLEADNFKAKTRYKELVIDLMRKSAQLSEAQEKLKRWQTELEIVAEQKGHNLCWRSMSDLLKNTIGHPGNYPDPENITREEFELGCRAYLCDLFDKV